MPLAKQVTAWPSAGEPGDGIPEHRGPTEDEDVHGEKCAPWPAEAGVGPPRPMGPAWRQGQLTAVGPSQIW